MASPLNKKKLDYLYLFIKEICLTYSRCTFDFVNKVKKTNSNSIMRIIQNVCVPRTNKRYRNDLNNTCALSLSFSIS